MANDTLYVPPENDTLKVDDVNRIKRHYMSEADVKRIRTDWTQWLDAGESISTSAWSVEDSENLTLANGANASGVTTIYATSATDSQGRTYYVKNQITTDSTPARKETRFHRVDIVRKS